jgi:hypothetical protein
MEIRVDEAKLFQDDLGALHALRIFVVLHLLEKVFIDLAAVGEMGLHLMFDRQLRVF